MSVSIHNSTVKEGTAMVCSVDDIDCDSVLAHPLNLTPLVIFRFLAVVLELNEEVLTLAEEHAIGRPSTADPLHFPNIVAALGSVVTDWTFYGFDLTHSLVPLLLSPGDLLEHLVIRLG